MKFRILKLIIIIVVFNLSTVLGENFENLYKLYDLQNYETLEIEVKKIDLKYSEFPEIKFFKTIFLENGDEAVKVYKEIFDDSNAILKKYISKKLGDYYYAKGYYLTASKYQEYLVEKNSTKNNSELQKDEKDKYIIQLGAFGLEENAQRLKKMLETQNLHTAIVQRIINEKPLFCVWMDGKSDFNHTLKYAEVIKKRKGLARN